MNNSTLQHLNRLLRDHLGASPAGGSLYRWFHSRDPEMFAVIARPGSDGEIEYERIPQIWERRWVMGRWMPPMSRRDPRSGCYIACSIPSDPLLERGVEPNERITMYTIHLRKQQIAIGERGIMRSFQESREYNQRQTNRETDAWSGDNFTNFAPKVPGARELFQGV